MKDKETTSTSVSEAPAAFNEATSNPLSGAQSAMDEDVKSNISARALTALAYSSSQTKESNKDAAITHRIELNQPHANKLSDDLIPFCSLLEVYGASVSFTIRLKVLVAVLKIATSVKLNILRKL